MFFVVSWRAVATLAFVFHVGLPSVGASYVFRCPAANQRVYQLACLSILRVAFFSLARLYFIFFFAFPWTKPRNIPARWSVLRHLPLRLGPAHFGVLISHLFPGEILVDVLHAFEVPLPDVDEMGHVLDTPSSCKGLSGWNHGALPP